jgi:monoamine oxidase
MKNRNVFTKVLFVEQFESLVSAAKNVFLMFSEKCSKQIIIVGSGASGMTAGSLLKRAGHKVTILESSDHIGGRIQTYRDLEEKWYSELGPMLVAKEDSLVRELVRQFGLTLLPFEALPIAFFIGNKRIAASEVMAGADANPILKYVFHKLQALKGDNLKALLEKTAELLKQPFEDFKKLSRNETITKYDKFSVKQWISQFENVTVGDLPLPRLLRLTEKSLVDLLIDQCVFKDGKQFDFIVGGFDLISQGLFPSIWLETMKNSRVTSIKQTKEGVKVILNISLF